MSETNYELSVAAEQELLALARATLEERLEGRKPGDYTPSAAGLREQRGAFVSLHHGDDLRGCIGQAIPDRELYRIVQACAVSAALEDHRFPPVRTAELADLTIEISVLTPLRRVWDPNCVEVGRHGLVAARGGRRGLLLPQVAVNYAWDRETFLVHTCRKAGLPDDAWQQPDTELFVFEAQVFSEE